VKQGADQPDLSRRGRDQEKAFRSENLIMVHDVYRANAVAFLALLLILAFFSLWACSSAPVRAPAVATSSIPQPPQQMKKEASVVEQELRSPAGPRTVVHEVAPMESIWRLSKMYEVPMESILTANHLKSGEPIHVGQKLIIPNTRVFRNVIPLYPNAEWKYVVIHHTATDIGNAALIDNTHHDRGFWYGLGYHFLIDNGTLGKGDGQLEVSPRWIKQQPGAHCKANGMNAAGIGVALVGNFSSEQPTPAQLQSLVYLVQTLCRYYQIPPPHVLRHRDVPGSKTECPGSRFPWQSFMKDFQQPVQVTKGRTISP
jgi:N-acetylmuramoyl-L-alanine amidase